MCLPDLGGSGADIPVRDAEDFVIFRLLLIAVARFDSHGCSGLDLRDACRDQLPFADQYVLWARDLHGKLPPDRITASA